MTNTFEILYVIESQKDATGNIYRIALEKGVIFTPLSKEDNYAIFQASVDMSEIGRIFESTQELLNKVPEHSSVVWKKTEDLNLVGDFSAWDSLENFILPIKGVVVGGRIYEEPKNTTKQNIVELLEKAVKFEDFVSALEGNTLDIKYSSAMGGYFSFGFRDIMPHKYDSMKVELVKYVKEMLND